MALDEFVVTQDFSAMYLDEEIESTTRFASAIIMSLNPYVPVTTLVIVNPLPAFVLRHRATHDVSYLVPRLRRVLNPLDTYLGRRLTGGSLQQIEFATERQNSIARLVSDERPRVQEFFPVLTDLRSI